MFSQCHHCEESRCKAICGHHQLKIVLLLSQAPALAMSLPYTAFPAILLELYSVGQILIYLVSPRKAAHVQQHSAQFKPGNMGDAFRI